MAVMVVVDARAGRSPAHQQKQGCRTDDRRPGRHAARHNSVCKCQIEGSAVGEGACPGLRPCIRRATITDEIHRPVTPSSPWI